MSMRAYSIVHELDKEDGWPELPQGKIQQKG